MRESNGERGVRSTAFVWAVVLVAVSATAAPATAHALEYDRTYAFGTQGGGVAVGLNLGTGNVYVAAPLVGVSPGAIERFDSAGDPLAPPTLGGGTYGGVAVDQASQRIHVFDPSLFGGSPNIATFDASGAPVDPASFPVTANPPPALDFNQIAVDDAGDIYYPNASTDSVERFDAAGALQGSIGAGGALVDPSSVAVDSDGDVYVVDGTVNGGSACEGSPGCDDVSGGRVQRFPAGGGAPVVVQDGNASSVAVDPVTDNVLVGDGLGTSFEVVVYDESGSELTRFGSGRFGGAGFFPGFNNEIAVSATRRVYVTDPGSLEVEMFDVLPEATTGEALNVGATASTLTGTVDPNHNPLFGCRFEYGTTLAYERSTPCVPDIGSGSGPADVSAVVSGLQPGTGYHFRLVATNVGVSAAGADQTFVTGPGPPEPQPPAGPPPLPPASPPAPPSVVAPSPAPGTLRTARRARMSGKKALLRLTCKGSAGATCRGTLTLRARRAKKGGNRTVVIGRARVQIAAGRTRTVSVPITRAGRRLLAKRSRGLRVTVSAPGATARSIVLEPAPRSTKRGRARA